jgi:hypothetical protein
MPTLNFFSRAGPTRGLKLGALLETGSFRGPKFREPLRMHFPWSMNPFCHGRTVANVRQSQSLDTFCLDSLRAPYRSTRGSRRDDDAPRPLRVTTLTPRTFRVMLPFSSPNGSVMRPHSDLIKRVHDAIYAETVGKSRDERKIPNSRACMCRIFALNSVLQLRLILGYRVA